MKRKALHCKQGLPKVPGKPRGTDRVPAWLTPGEAVLNAGAAELMGRDKIELLNQMGMRLGSSPTPEPQALAHGTARVQPVYAASGWTRAGTDHSNSLWKDATTDRSNSLWRQASSGRGSAFAFPQFFTQPAGPAGESWPEEPMNEPFGGGREPMPGYYARGTEEVFPRLYDPARFPPSPEPMTMTMGEKMAPFANRAPAGMTDMTRGLGSARAQYPGAMQFAEPGTALTPVPGTRFTTPGPALQPGQGIRVTGFDDSPRDLASLKKGTVRIPAEAMPMAGRAGLENRMAANLGQSFAGQPAGSMAPLARRAGALNEALPGGVWQARMPEAPSGPNVAGAPSAPSAPSAAPKAANPYNPDVGDVLRGGLQRTGQAVNRVLPAVETAGRWLNRAGRTAGYLGTALEAGDVLDVATDPNKTGLDKANQTAATLGRMSLAGAGAAKGASLGMAGGPFAEVTVPLGALIGGTIGYMGADSAIKVGRKLTGTTPDDPAASSRGVVTRAKEAVFGGAPAAKAAGSPATTAPVATPERLGGRVFASKGDMATAARGMIAEGVTGAPVPADYYQTGLSRTALGNGLERVAVQPSQAMLDANEDRGRGYGRSAAELQRIGWSPAATPTLGAAQSQRLDRMLDAPLSRAPGATDPRQGAMMQSFQQAAREIPQLVYLATKATTPEIREGAQRALQSLSSLTPGLGQNVMAGYETDQNAGVRQGQQAYYAGAGAHYQSEAEKNRDMVQNPARYLGSRKGEGAGDKRSFQLIPDPAGGDAAAQIPVMVGQDGTAIPVRLPGAGGKGGQAYSQESLLEQYDYYLKNTPPAEQVPFEAFAQAMKLRAAGAS